MAHWIGMLPVFLGALMIIAASAEGQVCEPGPSCVNSADIVDGQVRTQDIASQAVTAAKLQAGAVNGTKVANESLTERHLAVGTRVVVAPNGGDYPTIAAALAAINPTEDRPFVIEILPGVYDGNLTLKGYVHLQGSDGAIITTNGGDAITIEGSDVTVSGLRIFGRNQSRGIVVVSSTPMIRDNIINGHGGPGVDFQSGGGTLVDNSLGGNGKFGGPSLSIGVANPLIRDNRFSSNGGPAILNEGTGVRILGNRLSSNGTGIVERGNATIISDNDILDNGGTAILVEGDASPVISRNTIHENKVGIKTRDRTRPTIVHNIITDNGGPFGSDVQVEAPSAPMISLNVYDKLKGKTGAGQFNVTSAGAVAEAP